MCNRTSGNLEIPRCAIAHLRFDASHRPGLTALNGFVVEPVICYASARPRWFLEDDEILTSEVIAGMIEF